MKSSTSGKSISQVEIQNISKHGVWIFAIGVEYFLPYTEFPWFKKANVAEIYNVELLRGRHLHWPDLDLDLELASLKNPEKYPLIYK
jgi:hypothetical protein